MVKFVTGEEIKLNNGKQTDYNYSMSFILYIQTWLN